MRTALVAIACIGCSSHYMPRSQGRVAVSMIDGKPVYIRDGNIYEHGMLGGGLVDAVRGNRSAEAAALEYHDHMRDGLLEMLLGTAAMCGGMTYAAVQAAQSPPDNPHVDAAPIIVGLAGMVIMLYGAGELASAEPYRWDAINLFNDGPGAVPPGTLGPPGYSASASAKATLHMRE